jgi:E3 SUMO-protein ligase RanBP2
LAETENIRDENVFSLRLKMVKAEPKKGEKGGGSKHVEEMILKEIAARPHDVNFRIRLVKFLLDEKRTNDAFKYCFDLEMKAIEIFLLSIDWYTTVASVLNQSVHDSWNYWCLLLITMEKQIFLTLKKDLSLQAIKQNNIKEVSNLLFEFDQVIKKASDCLHSLTSVKELADEFINHFRAQLSLHIAALLFQKQKIANNDQWRETTKKCLPFLLFAFQSATVNTSTEATWLKNTNETIRNLFTHLKKEGAFRCTQAARTILACKAGVSGQVSPHKCWLSIDDIFNQVRETCADLNWRKSMYRQLFANTDQQSKISSSYFVQNSFFQEPRYEIISFNEIDTFEDLAQYLYPSSLDHHVYLGLGRKDLHTYKTKTFSGLNLSTANLINCNPETINRLDMDCFLYCAIIQAKRRLEAEKMSYETFNNKPDEKPIILPAANLVEGLCTEEQNEWWLSAFKIYKNISGENLAQLKATLQFGIEAIRGIDTPKVDSIILLKLGDILLARSNNCDKAEERRHLEIRVEYIYKFAMKMLRNRESDNMRRLFKFTANNFDVERAVDQLAGTAIGHLSGIYFKREEYKDFIEDFSGLQNAWAHFFKAEAYKKLDETGKTPKKSRKLYAEKAKENLIETLALLDANENIDKNNPLRIRVEKDLKRLQYDLSTSFTEELDFHNTSQNGYGNIEEEIYHNASASSFRGRREAGPNYSEKFNEVESLIRKLSDLVISVRDDVLCVRNDITTLRDEMLNIRGDITDLSVNKDTKALNDIYKSIEDLSWNVTCMMNLGAAGSALPPNLRFPPPPPVHLQHMYNTAYPIYPMQFAGQPQRGPPLPPHLQFGDQLGLNMMGNYASPILPSPSAQQQPAPMQMQPVLPPSQMPQQVQVPSISQIQPQIPITNGQKSSLLEALNTPSVLNTWTNTFNPSPIAHPSPQQQQPNIVVAPPQIQQPIIQNKPVEKAPPVNVVITSSDPLPAQNSFVSQPTLSVTIPPQHIKNYDQTKVQKEPLKPKDDNTKVKETFGGFTGSLVTPTATPDKIVTKVKEAENKQPAQSSPFANFTFGQSANKSFSELFGGLNTSKTEVASATSTTPRAATYDEDDVEHYEPTAQFEPVIPLPDLIETKTGEEEEDVLFTHRAKLLRYDAETKEWKERGIGEMKVLAQKADPTKARLLMRREQIFKLCCNMPITKELKFTKMKETALSFGGQDFSETDGMRTEKLTVRFKTAELTQSFMDAVKDVQKKMSEQKTVEKPKEPEKKKEEEVKGFGDKFKPKAGSWNCDACYISNKPETLYCVACESPKDNTVPKKEAKSLLKPADDAPKFNFGMPNASGFSFGVPQATTPAAVVPVTGEFFF